MKKKAALALVALLMAIAGASLLMYWRANRSRKAAPAGAADLGNLAFTNPAPTQQSAKPAVHKVNPYAVVRHGICVPSNVPDQEEASRKKWEALLQDPVWQSIFSGVNPEEYSLVKTSLPLHRYVTYWKLKNGKAIHWTAKKILIPAGTSVFTDKRGDMYLCACGNQVAAFLPPTIPGTILPPEEQPPVAYLVPPQPEPYPDINLQIPEETLTRMAPPEVATGTPYSESELVPPSSPLTGPTAPAAPLVPILLAGSSPPGSGPGSGPPGSGPGSGPPGSGPGSGPPGSGPGSGPPGSGPGSGPPGGGPGSGPPGGVPAATPEPGSLSLILIGIGASIVARRYHKRARRSISPKT
jgi:hypothetical protein